MLTPFDQYPIHQHSRPFSEVPSTDVSWDDGLYFSAFSPTEGIYLHSGMRINPNTDMIGGWVVMSVAGRQYTLRFSRVWRPDCDMHIGPLRMEFIKPFRDVRMVLEANDSPVTFDFNWRGVAPPFEEEHHLLVWRGRRVIDQTRYIQVGAPTGWLNVGGKRYEIKPETWGGSHDHSWGQYEGRRPLAGLKEYLPPGPPPSGRALRYWTMFSLPNYSGFIGLHEDKDGVCRNFDDFLGTAFEGAINYGWDGRQIDLVSAHHELTFKPGSRMLTGGKVTAKDAEGGTWLQEFEIGTLPWLFAPLPYYVGSWSDGGTMQTYHGEGPVLEWDEIDISGMPLDYQRGKGPLQKNAHGHIYGARLRMTAPDGSVSEGLQHITFWVEGEYSRYGFKAATFP